MLFFSLSSIMCKHRCHLLRYHSEGGGTGSILWTLRTTPIFWEPISIKPCTHGGESRIKKIFPRLSEFLDRESGKMVCVCGCVWNWKCQQKKGNNVIRRRLGGGGAGGCWENLEKCPPGLRLFLGGCRSFSISVWQVAGGRGPPIRVEHCRNWVRKPGRASMLPLPPTKKIFFSWNSRRLFPVDHLDQEEAPVKINK